MDFRAQLRVLIPAILSFIFISKYHRLISLPLPKVSQLGGDHPCSVFSVLKKVLLLLLVSSISVYSQYQWKHDIDIAYVRPIGEGSGVIRKIDDNTGGGIIIQSVKGQVQYTLEARTRKNNYAIPNTMRYEFFLHTHDSDGNDISTSISSVLTGLDNITWNSNSVGDGVYAVTVRLFSAGLNQDTDISRFRTRPLIIIVDNDGSPLTGAQWLPSTGYSGMRFRNYDGTGIDWIKYPGTYSLPNTHPYPYTFITPPQTSQERENLSSSNAWFTETMWGALNSRYDDEPAFQKTGEGQPIIVGTRFPIGNQSSAEQVFLGDGYRNQAGFIRNTVLTASLRGPGFLGTTWDGRFIFIGPTKIYTIAGYVTSPNVLPCILGDCSNPKELHGTFTNNEYFNFGDISSYIAFDLNDINKIYITDTKNERIALVEVNGCDDTYENCDSGYPLVSTFAGAYDISGFQDGTLANARFNSPQGMVIIGHNMYVADVGNDAIRKIDLSTGQVITLDFSGFAGTQLPSNIVTLHRDSAGNLLAKQSGTNNRAVYKIDFQNNTITDIGDVGNKDYFEVDWRGNMGQIDDIIYPGYNIDHGIGRLHNGVNTLLLEDSGNPNYFRDAMGGGQGSYPLSLAIDDEESRIITTHQYRERPTVFRPLQPNDPVPTDVDLAQRGLYVYHYGTVWDFNPSWQRSSLSSIHGTVGHHWLGNTIPLFDDLAQMSDIDLANYIKNGMAGHIARPEITGKDMQALIYFIKILSVQGKTQEFNPETIKQHLAGTEYWPNVNDQANPVISDINVSDLGNGRMQVSWTTNEPTLGVIRYGTNYAEVSYTTYYGVQEDNYGLLSDLENTYSQQHSLIIENVPSNQQMKFKIISKDKAGNIGKSGEMLFRSPDTSPPSTPQGLNANPVNESQIDLFWNPSNDPESGIANYNVYRDNVLVAQPSGTTFSDIGLNENTTYTYEVSAVNGAGLESGKSPSATATTGLDETPPTIISAGTAQSLSEVYVKYSEPVEENSATNVNNYSIDNGISISSASLAGDLRTVNLSTSSHSAGMNYVLTVNNVRDRASNPNTIANNTQVPYTADDTASGDVTPPTIISAGTGENLSLVTVNYSEPVEVNSATNVNNYSINNAINILSASLATDLRTVNLNTSPHTSGMNYILTVNNILDLASNPNMIANNTQVPYTVNDTASGPAGTMNLTVVSGKPYEVVMGLSNGDQVYIDRNYIYGGIPDSLTGNNTVYIKTANDDKLNEENPFLTFDISEPLKIYIAHDDRYQIKPLWLGRFTNTGQVIIIGNEPHTLFMKTFPVGRVELGRNINPSEPEGNDMYTVILRHASGSNPPAGNDPSTFTLSQNYPNPFNPSTQITYELAHKGRVELKVFDLLGREVAVLVDKIQSQGKHIAKFNAEGLSSGFYFYRIQSGDLAEARMMTLRK